MSWLTISTSSGFSHGLAVGVDLAVKAALAWLIAAALSIALGRRRALARSAVWNLCLATWVLLPLTVALLPRWRIECLPEANLPLVESGDPAAPFERESILMTAAQLYEEAVVRPRDPSVSPPRWSAPHSTQKKAIPKLPASAESNLASPAAAWSVDWRIVAVAVYAAGTIIIALRLAASLLAARRLGRRSFELVDREWKDALVEWKRRLGLRRRVQVACSSAVEVPLAMGWLRPTIIVPPRLLCPSARKIRGSVLAHELAHVQRGDFLWQLLAQATLALYWPHPLVWALVRSAERAREEACDDVSVSLVRSPKRYRAALLEVASWLVRRPRALPGVAMARTSELGKRIGRIQRDVRPRSAAISRPSLCVLATSLVTAAVLVGSAELGRNNDRSEPKFSATTLSVQVVHRVTKEPIAAAAVKSWSVGDRQERECAPTDSKGRTSITLPARAGWGSFTVRAHKEGFAPTRFTWSEEQMGTAPADLSLTLEPASSMGGVVLDESGAPIEGVRIRLWGTGQPHGERVDLLDDEVARTDAEGRWRYDAAPSDLKDMTVRAIHSERGFSWANNLDPEKLRSREAVCVLKRDQVVQGRVLGPDRLPVQGARVLEGRAIFRTPEGKLLGIMSSLETHADGGFRVVSTGGAECWLTVLAPGHAPASERILLKDAETSVEIQLERARVLKGRVIDPEGSPVPGALVEVEHWGRVRSLDWTATTDADGRFAWNDAPDEAVTLQVSKRGHALLQSENARASEKELVLTLPRALRIAGRVLDVATGLPVEQFKVSISSSNGAHCDWPKFSLAFKSGTYDVLVPRARPATLIRVEAEGYLPAISREFSPLEGAEAFDFLLLKGDRPRGIVKGADGQPVGGAQVFLLEPDRRILIENGEVKDAKTHDPVITGADGAFQLNPREDPPGLLVLHERGYAVLGSIDASRLLDVTLVPWGRIEGQLRLGGKGVEGERVSVASWTVPDQVRLEFSTTTLADGRFVFERLFARPSRVSHEVNVAPIAKRERLESTRTESVEIEAGATARVLLGGGGRPLSGRIVKAADSTGDPEWARGHVQLYARTDEFERRYALPLAEDGSFRIEDVLPGTYQLDAYLHEREAQKRGILGPELGAVKREILVSPAESLPVAQDLGLLEMKVHQALTVGSPAPLFEVKNLDGGTIRLADLRGKVVLIDFWATWCGICHAVLPDLRKLRERFRGDDRVVILGLSLDEDIEAARTYVARNKIDWPQGFIGKWSQSDVRADYGISSIPWCVLIGKDGKVVAANMGGAPGFDLLISEALARKAAQP